MRRLGNSQSFRINRFVVKIDIAKTVSTCSAQNTDINWKGTISQILFTIYIDNFNQVLFRIRIKFTAFQSGVDERVYTQ